MTAILAIWMAEFLLEASGSILNFKRARLLSVILAIIALMDVVTFFFFRFWPENYWLATWTRHAIRNLLFVLLGCSVCGMFAEKVNRIQAGITAAVLSLSTGAMVLAMGMSGKTLSDKLLEGEIVACLMLLAYIALAWIGSAGKLSADNKWIAAGFVVMVGSDLVFTILWTFWDGARHWYPLGCISAQLIWIAGPLRKVRLPEFRKSLEKKFPHVEEMRVM